MIMGSLWSIVLVPLAFANDDFVTQAFLSSNSDCWEKGYATSNVHDTASSESCGIAGAVFLGVRLQRDPYCGRVRDFDLAESSAQALNGFSDLMGPQRILDIGVCLPVSCLQTTGWTLAVSLISRNFLTEALQLSHPLPLPRPGIDAVLHEGSADLVFKLGIICGGFSDCRFEMPPSLLGTCLEPTMTCSLGDDSEWVAPPNFVDDNAGWFGGWPALSGGTPELTSAHADAVTFVYYHKTGTEVTQLLQDSLRHLWNWRTRDRIQLDESLQRFAADPPAVEFTPKELVRVLSPDVNFVFADTVKQARLVHFVRDPIVMVVSALRYHQRSIEQWPCCANKCPICSQEDMLRIFSGCAQRCSLRQILLSSSVSQADDFNRSLEVMTAVLRQDLRRMTLNVQQWAIRPDVLHVSVDQFQRDFMRTANCVLRFLVGTSSDDDASNESEGAVAKALRQRLRAAGADLGSRRKTFSAEDAALRRALLEREDFAKAHWTLGMVLTRDADAYGCPLPQDQGLVTVHRDFEENMDNCSMRALRAFFVQTR